MPDMNENAETQQEYFGVRTDNKRTLCNALKRIEELEEKLANADYQLEGRDLEIKELKAQIDKMKLCQICKHYQWESCNYHPLNEKDCKANNHKLFELVGDKRK